MSRLAEIRKARGLSQAELADETGVNLHMIQHYEQGTKDINQAAAATLYKLSIALGCYMESQIEHETI